jgi:predicted glycoside hydrolase/deacetylase ChbG (UPF0249 family)
MSGKGRVVMSGAELEHGNPALLRMGYSPSDPVVIIHADDLGMCHAANVAFERMLDFNWVRCGSVMVPCPWFLELAALSASRPEADVGVHLTLNSEWATYRWPPISTRDPSSGLVDGEGYLPRTVEEVHDRLVLEAATAEMRAQIERALDAGVDVTHIDTHMGSIAHVELFPTYIALALEFQVPFMTARFTPEDLRGRGVDPALGEGIEAQFAQLEAAGIPLVDHLAALELDHSSELLSQYKHAFDSIKPGLTHLVVHPCAPGFDMEAISQSAADRIADYQMLVSEELKAHVEEVGVKVIGYRELRGLMRGEDI